MACFQLYIGLTCPGLSSYIIRCVTVPAIPTHRHGLCAKHNLHKRDWKIPILLLGLGWGESQHKLFQNIMTYLAGFQTSVKLVKS